MTSWDNDLRTDPPAKTPRGDNQNTEGAKKKCSKLAVRDTIIERPCFLEAGHPGFCANAPPQSAATAEDKDYPRVACRACMRSAEIGSRYCWYHVGSSKAPPAATAGSEGKWLDGVKLDGQDEPKYPFQKDWTGPVLDLNTPPAPIPAEQETEMMMTECTSDSVGTSFSTTT